jgi:hypothetical protein
MWNLLTWTVETKEVGEAREEEEEEKKKREE